ncbi:MAG: 3'-5' exonuclease [Bacteroidales bacterium]
MQLNLKKPLLFFDIESTGLNTSKDRIVELSCVKVFPDGHEEVKTRRMNPTIPITPEAQAIHGISNEDVKNEPTFKQIAKSLAIWMKGCDIAGYNSNKFDIPMLAEEFLRADVELDLRKAKFIDVQTIFYKMEPRTLIAAYQFYCQKDLTAAHSAEADTRATYEVLKGQLDKYGDALKNNVDFLSEYTTRKKNVDYAARMIYNENDEAIFNFGKHRGKKVIDILQKEPSYFDWMLKGDFPLDTKQQLTKIKLSLREDLSFKK